MSDRKGFFRLRDFHLQQSLYYVYVIHPGARSHFLGSIFNKRQYEFEGTVDVTAKVPATKPVNPLTDYYGTEWAKEPHKAACEKEHGILDNSLDILWVLGQLLFY